MKKRLVSAVVAVCLMFGTVAALPQNAFTGSTVITASATSLSDFDYKVYDTSVVINKYKGSESTVTIPETISGKPVTHINTEAFKGNTSVTKVSLPKSLLGIKQSAFEGCTKLSEIIGFENTGVTYIETYAFRSCTSLKTVNLPKTLKTIAVSVFDGCSALTSVYNLENTQVTTISNSAFQNCTKLSYVKFPTTLSTLGSSAFYNCDLESVDLSSTKLTKIPNYCFRENSDLTTFKMPSGVTQIGIGAFLLDKSLVTVRFPSSLKTVDERAFAKCYRLNSPYMFELCYDLESIGKWAFLECTDLKKLYLPSSLKTLGDEFYGYHIETYEELYGGSYEQVEAYFGSPRTIIMYPTAKVAKNYYNAFNTKYPYEDTMFKLEQLTCKHSYSDTVTKEATCTATGVRTFTCKICKDSYTQTINIKQHSYGKVSIVSMSTPVKYGQTKKKCESCGHIEYTSLIPSNVRVYGSNRYLTSTYIADQLKLVNNSKPYEYYVIADGRKFADALSASYLARVIDAPILLIMPGDEKVVTDYIKANCGDFKPKAYIIGGTGAVSEDSCNKIKEVCGNSVYRLDGQNRYETSRKVLLTAAVAAALANKDLGSSLIIADGRNYADALSASATGQPILLVDGAAKELTKEEIDSVKLIKNASVVIAGGEGAVSKEMENAAKQVKTVTRLAGADRYKTSTAIANYFFKTPSAVTLATGMNFPDGLCGGPLGYATNCPLILTSKGNEAAANAYVTSKSVKTAWILGGPTVVSDDTVNAVLKK